MYKIYQVQSGESLESIAAKVKTTVEELKKLNGIMNDIMLMPGTFLIVPMIDGRFQNYVVEQGDTIYSISKRYGVDPNMVLKLNGLKENDFIYPNQEIIIPSSNYNFYITNEGDTIASVLEKTNITIEDLLNNNSNILLEEDQMIIY